MLGLSCATAVAAAAAAGASRTVESAAAVVQFGTFEASLLFSPPAQANPFTDVSLFATFACSGVAPVRVRGFYDGGGVYRVRHMPRVAGNCTYATDSATTPALDGHLGAFVVTPQTPQALGQSPVRVRNTRSFEHEDGSAHFSVGTTSYAWIHQNDTMIQNTVATLRSDPAKVPFNKMRMTTFPKWYWFNKVEPAYYPYAGTAPDQWDFTTFNPVFWQRLDDRVLELMAAGVEADIILFHPYDNGHWGFDCMGGRNASTYNTAHDELYLQYIVARLGAFRNVWWSMANEWDLVGCKHSGVPEGNPVVWDRLFEVLAREDRYGHLTSIHNCVVLYNHSKPWITHISSQGGCVVVFFSWGIGDAAHIHATATTTATTTTTTTTVRYPRPHS
jgi:hypothetical protein